MKDPFQIYNSPFEGKRKGPNLDWEEGALFQAEEPEDYYATHGDEPRISFYLAALFLIFGILAIRLGVLQIKNGSHFRVLAEDNRLRIQQIPAPRGIIFDSQNKPLVGNMPSFDLVATPVDLQADYESKVQDLAKTFGFNADDALAIIKKQGPKSFQQVAIMQNIPKDYALLFESKSQEYPGFAIENNPIRHYDDPQVFSHVLGYTGKITDAEMAKNTGYGLTDYIGKTGLELTYEKYLKGEDGQKQVEVDARGNMKDVHGEVDPQPGDSLVLNIDGDLQRELYKNIVQFNGNKKAAAVAVDPQTGQVLAIISLPGFDNNLFSQGISHTDYTKLTTDKNQPLFNRVIQGTYPPGSTIKPVIASAALQEKVVDENTTIFDNGDLVYGGFHFHGWKLGGLGPMNVRSAIAMSSDIYFYTVGGGSPSGTMQGLGPDRISKYDYLFGMGQKLGIDLNGEQPGVIASREYKKTHYKTAEDQMWYPGDTYHISIGQGDMLVTPLQVVMWTSVAANGGTLYKPYIVDKVLDNSNNVLLQNQPKVIRADFIDPKNIQIVREGMRQTVTSGTARSLSSLPISAAGKTGTAQFDGANPNASHAWFTAFAPYEDPQIAITVLIEAGGEGSTAASPVVRETLKWWAENRFLPAHPNYNKAQQ